MSNVKNQNYKKENKKTKKVRVNPNEVNVELYLPADLNENIKNEIIDVLEDTKFNKISIPLGTYRCIIDSEAKYDDVRVCTIGYIRNYDAETKRFTVVIFNKFIDTIKDMINDIKVELQFSTYKESLRTITKFNIVYVAPSESECVEAAE